MKKDFRHTLHVKLDKGDIVKFNELQANYNDVSKLETMLDLFTNYTDYDIVPFGDIEFFGSERSYYNCLVNGGEYAVEVYYNDCVNLLKGRTVIFQKCDYELVKHDELYHYLILR